MLKTQAQILLNYNQKIINVTEQISKTKKLIDQLSFLRIGLFLAEILLFVLLVRSENDGWRLLIQFLLLVPVLLFVLIVHKQSKLDREVEYQKQLLWVYQNESNILNGLENGYDNGQAFESELHPYTSDLDIFGRSSLFALLNRTSTKNGTDLLAARLSSKTSMDQILTRQEAVRKWFLKLKKHLSLEHIYKVEM